MTAIPSSFNLIQQESVNFNNPVSENVLTQMGASINALVNVIIPVGTIVETMLTEAQFQAEVGNTNWILADGRNVAGSRYTTVTGNSNIPDLRGVFLRSKNNGRSDGNQNPDGDLALGTFQADMYASHNHPDPGHFHNLGAGYLANTSYGSNNNTYMDQTTVRSTFTAFTNIQPAGGNETRSKNVTVNCMIRVN
jgi:hypothetical protein